MAQTNYEVTYIIKTDLDEESKSTLIKRYDDILGADGTEIVDSKDWSKRRLAYEINGSREGIYHIVNVKTDNDASLTEFDRLAKIDADVLRHMIVKRDDKD